MRKFIPLFLLLCFFSTLPFLPAQSSQNSNNTSQKNTGGSEDDNKESEKSSSLTLNAQLALSTSDYRVTAGDIYTLVYAVGSQKVEYVITVDSSYRIRVSNLGVIDASGKTYNQLKTQVESIVSNNYPMSGVQFVLTQPATFLVYIRGEVQNASEATAWALSRLSSVLDKQFTDFSSTRDVQIKSSNGQTRMYDLFLAQRSGNLSQDPYLRPGDEITINRAVRSVTINGAVERPGKYQLKDGEHLKELVELYGSGFTPVADPTRLELTRLVNSQSVSGDKIFLSEANLAGTYELQNYDVITVPQITSLQPVMFVEGAVNPIVAATEGSGTVGSTSASQIAATPTVSTRIVVPFSKGENLASLVRRNAAWFSAVSDTQNAYIIRGGRHISINLNPMLYDATYRSEVSVEENDTLIIPFRQYFITVAGAVRSPGRYAYIPDREWDYYIAAAGGFVKGMNAWDAITITDMGGKKLKKTDVIVPETIITAKTNDFLYYFNQYSPVILTTLSIITTFLTIRATTGLWQ